MSDSEESPQTKKASKPSKKTGAKAGKEKKPKDPNAPKRALTAYILYGNHVREKLREENPDITFGETGMFTYTLTHAHIIFVFDCDNQSRSLNRLSCLMPVCCE
jgi:hypothetical protein